MYHFNKVVATIIIGLMLGLLVSCGGRLSGTVTPTTSEVPTPYPQLPPPDLATVGSEFLRISGSGDNSEHTFLVNSQEYLRINWIQYCKSDFYLSVINPDQPSSDENGNEVIFSIAASPSSGYGDYEFTPGKYMLNIKSDGSWEIWIENIHVEQPTDEG